MLQTVFSGCACCFDDRVIFPNTDLVSGFSSNTRAYNIKDNVVGDVGVAVVVNNAPPWTSHNGIAIGDRSQTIQVICTVSMEVKRIAASRIRTVTHRPVNVLVHVVYKLRFI